MEKFVQENFNRQLVAIGNICNNYKACLDVIEELSFYILIGGIRIASIFEDIENIKNFLKKANGIYIIGTDDLQFIKENYHDSSKYELISWIESQNLYATISLVNRNIFTFLYGGVTSDIKCWADMSTSFDVALIKNAKIDGAKRSWHTAYNGRFGQICSHNNASTQVDLFIHSSSIGLTTGASSIVTFDNNGINNINYLLPT